MRKANTWVLLAALLGTMDLSHAASVTVSDGTYTIHSKASNNVLGVEGSSKDDLAKIVENPYNRFEKSQEWIVQHRGDGYYSLLNANSGRCLDVERASKKDAALIIQFEYKGGANQLWEIREVEPGYVALFAKHSGKALDRWSSVKPVQQYAFWAGDNQLWALKPTRPTVNHLDVWNGQDDDDFMAINSAIDVVNYRLTKLYAEFPTNQLEDLVNKVHDLNNKIDSMNQNEVIDVSAVRVLSEAIDVWAGPEPPVAVVPCLGVVVGGTEEVQGVTVEHFLGLPYATAERYQPPVMVNDWEDTIDGTTYRESCPGSGVVYGQSCEALGESEDCLFLNVFRPKREPCDEDELRPVAVFIHGGTFRTGCAAVVPAAGLAARSANAGEDIIYVAMNYRLNIFGFLGGEELRATDGSTGNFGLQDQRMALEWVQKHIKAFGGNPDDVTFMGHSSGAAAITAHMSSPKSKGLYHRVIGQSGLNVVWGANNMEWAETKLATAMSIVNCTTGECMRALPTSVLAAAAPALRAGPAGSPYTAWAPVVDGVELTAHPWAMAQAGPLPVTVPILGGWMRDEFALFTANHEFIAPWDVDEEGFKQYAAGNLPEEDREANVARLVELYGDRAMYPADLGKFSMWWWALTTLASDRAFVCAGLEGMKLWQEHNPTLFSYTMVHPPKTSKVFAPGAGPDAVVVPHELDMFYTNDCALPPNDCVFDEPDRAYAKMVSGFWVNFINCGFLPSPWTLFDGCIGNVLSLDSEAGTGLTTISDFRSEQCAFWVPFLEPAVQF